MPSSKKPYEFHGYRTVSELAAYVGVSARTVERWWVNGEIPEPVRTEAGMKLWGPTQCRMILDRQWHKTKAAKKAERRIIR